MKTQDEAIAELKLASDAFKAAVTDDLAKIEAKLATGNALTPENEAIVDGVKGDMVEVAAKVRILADGPTPVPQP